MKQTDEAKLERSREILEALKEARGGKLLGTSKVLYINFMQTNICKDTDLLLKLRNFLFLF